MSPWIAGNTMAVTSISVYLRSFLAVFFLAYEVPRRRKSGLCILAMAVAGGILLDLVEQILLISVYGHNTLLFSILLFSGAFATTILSTYIVLDLSFASAMLIGASGYAIQHISARLKTLLCYVSNITMVRSPSLLDMITDGLSLLLVGAIIGGVFHKYISVMHYEMEDRYKWLFSGIIMIVCIGLSKLMGIGNTNMAGALMLESVFSIIVCILILYLQFELLRSAQITRERDLILELLHRQSLRYEESKESIQQVNEKYHDMRKLLESFRGILPEDKRKELEKEIEMYDTFVRTGNEVLDVLLTEKEGICKHRDIQMTCSMPPDVFEGVADMDVYSILSNALDNAVEAVSQLPEEREKYISLVAHREWNVINIHVENPYETDICFEEGLPQSRRDHRFHGFGMKSMKHMAEKYNGDIITTARDGVFYLDVVLLSTEGERGKF